jgi:DNA-binding CsgD family transcriptional regulator
MDNKKHEEFDYSVNKPARKSRAKNYPGWEAVIKANPKYSEIEGRLAQRFPSLSPIELWICVLAREGKPSYKIGEMLGIEEQTVNNHRTDIRKSLRIKHGERLKQFLRRF